MNYECIVRPYGHVFRGILHILYFSCLLKYHRNIFCDTLCSISRHFRWANGLALSPSVVNACCFLTGSAENTYLSLVHLLNPQQDKKKEKDIYHSNLLIQRKNLTLGKVIGNGKLTTVSLERLFFTRAMWANVENMEAPLTCCC